MRIKRLALALILWLTFGTFICFAEDIPANTGTISFTSGAPDQDGVFTLEVSFRKMEFLTYQFAVRYDTTAVEPYDTEGKCTAKDFAGFSEFANPPGLHTIGEYLSAEDGFFDFSGYVLPNEKPEGLQKNGINAVTDENYLIYKLHFRVKADKDYGFELAMADGKGAFYSVFPQGASVFCDGGLKPGNAVFEYNGIHKTTQFDSIKYAPKPIMTKARRLKDTVYLENGNYASAVDGELAVIDKENKSVVPKLSEGVLLVPLRFVCSQFGFDVEWNEQLRTVTVKSDNVKSVITIGSDAVSGVEGEKKLTAIPCIMGDRTMVAADDISILLGLKVYIADGGKYTVITSSDEEWQPERESEKQALGAMEFAVSPLVKIFA